MANWKKPTNAEMIKYYEKELKRFKRKKDVISKDNVKILEKRLNELKEKESNSLPAKSQACKRSIQGKSKEELAGEIFDMQINASTG